MRRERAPHPEIRRRPRISSGPEGTPITPGPVATRRSPGRIPGQGPKGRRSGAYSPHSGVKIACGDKHLRRVASRVGPGSPLALRPGMRCEMAHPSPDPRTPLDLFHRHPPDLVRGRAPDLPVASPDKARRAADPGPTRLAAVSRSRLATSTCGAPPAEWVPALRSRSGRECAAKWRIHPRIRGRTPISSAGAPPDLVRDHPLSSPRTSPISRSHPRTRPEGPPIRGLLASQRHQDRVWRQALAARRQQSRSRLSATLRPGMRCEMAHPSPAPRTPLDLFH